MLRPRPGSFLLGGEKGLKDLSRADSGIPGPLSPIRITATGFSEAALASASSMTIDPPRLHGFAGVDHQVDQDFLELLGIGLDFGQRPVRRTFTLTS